ncbi:hypothetical protein [Mesorhizobium sp. B2-7-1]|uniref:hypothetical protein n=1 Tax=Mesorhizobium sp. B2-7-1 TaxID=2589909 RepID=UPI00112BF02E|nr:hypothetical protein [Mesorhizobium sp. B2-7-1]TPJ57246.1 hypothetical protein FJ471_22085 [Mesorhizobium sp. B2-7-1]
MTPEPLANSNPWIQAGLTFLTGALSGVAVFASVSIRSPESAAWLFDFGSDGLGVFDAIAVAWLFGQAAILVHHVLPGIAHD